MSLYSQISSAIAEAVENAVDRVSLPDLVPLGGLQVCPVDHHCHVERAKRTGTPWCQL